MALGPKAVARAALLAIVGLAFGPGTLGGFVWDDHSLIVDNAHLHRPEQLVELLRSGFWDTSNAVQADSRYFRPVVLLAYFAQVQAFGLRPFGFHVVNVLLHAACALLLFDVLRRRVAFDGRDAHAAVAGACAGAALFALHPTRTESVTWISGSTDLWMTLLCLLAWRTSQAPGSPGRAALIAALAGLALLAKESAIVFPVLLAWDAALIAPRGERVRASWPAAFAALGMSLALALRLCFVPLPSASLEAVLHTLPARVTSSFGHYLLATLYPFTPTVLRGKSALGPDGAMIFEPHSLLAGCAGLVLCALLALAALRSPRVKPWLADAGWFVLGLAPVINLVPMQLKALVADRFLYLPMIGVAALAARAVHACWPGLAPRTRLSLGAAGLSLCLTFGSVVVAHGRVFKDDGALWAYEFEYDPGRAPVLEQNAMFALGRGDAHAALALARAGYELARRDGLPGLEVRFVLIAATAALQVTPDLDQARLRAIREFYDGLAANGRGALALPALRAGGRELAPALSLDVRFDTRQRALLEEQLTSFGLQRVRAYARTRELARAIELARTLLREEPKLADGHAELAIMLARMRRFDDAARSIEEARALSPSSRFVVAAARAVATAQKVAALPADGELAQAQREAEIDLLLGAPGLARARLDPLLEAHPLEPALIALRARVDAVDRRADLARARIEAAREALPDAEAQWQTLLAELAAVR